MNNNILKDIAKCSAFRSKKEQIKTSINEITSKKLIKTA